MKLKTKYIVLLILFITHLSAFSQDKEDIFIIERNAKKGFIDKNLNVIVKPIYDDVENFRNGIAIIKKNKKFGLINTKGKVILQPIYERLYYSKSSDIVTFKKKNKIGLLNLEGNIILKGKFEYGTEVVNNNKNIIVNNGLKWALFNKNGKPISEFKYDFLQGNINSDLIVFKIDNKWGYLNDKGEILINPIYNYAKPFDTNLAIVKLDNGYNLINKKGVLISSTNYDEINSFQYGFNYNNKLYSLNSKVYYVKRNNKIGLINDFGEVVIEPIYDEISTFNEGLAYVKKDNKFGFIDLKGKIKIPIIYQDADYFSEGLAPVVKNGKWGFVDESNKVIIDFKYSGYVNSFFDGLAVYRKRNNPTKKAHYTKDLCGYINKKGEIEIEPVYKNAKRFINGVAIIEDERTEYIINKSKIKISLKERDTQVFETAE